MEKADFEKLKEVAKGAKDRSKRKYSKEDVAALLAAGFLQTLPNSILSEGVVVHMTGKGYEELLTDPAYMHETLRRFDRQGQPEAEEQPLIFVLNQRGFLSVASFGNVDHAVISLTDKGRQLLRELEPRPVAAHPLSPAPSPA